MQRIDKIPILTPNFRQKVLQKDAFAENTLVAFAGDIINEIGRIQARSHHQHITFQQLFASDRLIAALGRPERLLGLLALADTRRLGVATVADVVNIRAYVKEHGDCAYSAALRLALDDFDSPSEFASWIERVLAPAPHERNKLTLSALRFIYELLGAAEHGGVPFDRFLVLLGITGDDHAVAVSVVRPLLEGFFTSAKTFSLETGFAMSAKPLTHVFTPSDSEILLSLVDEDEEDEEIEQDYSDSDYSSSDEPLLETPLTLDIPRALPSPPIAETVAEYEYYEYYSDY